MISLNESRYDRQERIAWWDQATLRSASILVVGAGAIGNEVVKNLALMGIGHITVADMDTIESSNLSRCVFFSDRDVGQHKAEIVATRAAALNPEVAVDFHVGRVERYGVAGIARHQIVVAGLDSREARLWVNQACRKVGVPWVDGAIEGLDGVVRVFPPTGACYECTMGAADRELIARRRSCALLNPEQLASGMVPTNVTMASIVGGYEAQAAIRILHGHLDRMPIANGGIRVVGETDEVLNLVFGFDDGCMAHDSYGPMETLQPAPTLRLSLGSALGAADAVDFEDLFISRANCMACGRSVMVNRFLGALSRSDGICTCGNVLALESQSSVLSSDPLFDLPMAELGFARFDLVTLRTGPYRRHLAIAS